MEPVHPGEQRVLWKVPARDLKTARTAPCPGSLIPGGCASIRNFASPAAYWRQFLRGLPWHRSPPRMQARPTGRASGLLVVGALAVMAFLMITQPDTWQRTTGVVAGLLAGFKLMGDFLGHHPQRGHRHCRRPMTNGPTDSGLGLADRSFLGDGAGRKDGCAYAPPSHS